MNEKRALEFLAQTSSLAHVGGWELDLRTNRLEWTEEVYRIHEVDLDFQPTVEKGVAFYAPESIPIISEAVRRASTEGEPFDLELQLITAKGNRLWVRSIGQAYRENGEIVRIGGVFQDITAQRAIEDELRQSRERLEQTVQARTKQLEEALHGLEQSKRRIEEAKKAWEETFDAIGDGIAQVINFRFVRCNRAFASIFDVTLSDVIGRECREVFGERACLVLRSYAETVLHHGVREQTEVFVQDHWYEVAIERMESAEAAGILLFIFRDVTQRKRDQRQLELNEARFESLYRISQFQGTRQQMLDFALGEAIRLTNSAIGYIYYYDEKTELFTLNTWSSDVMKECRVVKPQTVYELSKTGIWGEAVRQRRPIMVNEYHLPNPLKKGYPEGHVALHRFLTIPVVIDERIVAVVGVANKADPYEETDQRQLTLLMDAVWRIVERRRLDEELQQMSLEWEEIFHSITDLITVQDLDFNVTKANRTATDFFGPSLLNNLGKIKCYQLFHGTDHPRPNCPVCLCRQTLKPESFDFYEPLLKKHIEVRSIPRYDKQQQLIGFLHVARDVTQHRKAEQQLRQAQKMEAVGQLSGGVAHDFNNILQVITCHTYTILSELSPGRFPFDEVKEIEITVEKAAYLVKQLLTFSRQQPVQMTRIDLNAVVTGFSKLLRRVLGEDVELALRLENGILALQADKGQIEQVLMNLCVNARDAMPRGGRITIETLRASGEGRKSIGGADMPPVVIEMRVSDTGTGIPTENLDRIFEPFFTTKEVGRGTGLGLATVFGIVQQHHGRIDVTSTVGQGTTFAVVFPAIDTVPIEGRETESSLQALGGNEVLLLAEDDDTLRQLMTDFLTRAGYRVHVAADGAAATSLAEKLFSEIDLYIFDVVMPKQRGDVIMEQIREKRADARFLFVSGYGAGFMEKVANDARCLFLSKPISPRLLLQKVRAMLDAVHQPQSLT